MISWTKTLIYLSLFLISNSKISAQNSINVKNNHLEALEYVHHLGVSAHRGNSESAPENTLATFQKVLEIGIDYIEIDVRTTKDGQLVILHDGSLDRTTNGKGKMKDFTLAELKALSAGKGFSKEFESEKIPTLGETLSLISYWNSVHKAKTNLYVDCKDVLAEPLINALKKYKLLKNAVFYGSDEFLLELKSVHKRVKVMPSLSHPNELFIKKKALKPYAFDVKWSIVNQELVTAIHKEGIKVFTDLLGFYDHNESYIKATKYKVDVIQTDHVNKVYSSLLNQKTH
jgi:glycerophosphoryl diester phosphodiesterase